MFDFDKQKNALRTRYKAEQRQITKDCYRTIGHLNTAIGKVNSPEAREALRAERERVHEAMLRSHELNKTCYLHSSISSMINIPNISNGIRPKHV